MMNHKLIPVYLTVFPEVNRKVWALLKELVYMVPTQDSSRGAAGEKPLLPTAIVCAGE